jgi:hypothetical protein
MTHLLVSENLKCSLENIIDRLLAHAHVPLQIAAEYFVSSSVHTARFPTHFDLCPFPPKVYDRSYSCVLRQQTDERESQFPLA